MTYLKNTPVKVNAPMQLTLDMFAKPSNTSDVLPSPPPNTPVSGPMERPVDKAPFPAASTEVIDEAFVHFEEAFAVFSFDFEEIPAPTTTTIKVTKEALASSEGAFGVFAYNEAPLLTASAEVIEEAFAAFEEAFGVFAWEG